MSKLRNCTFGIKDYSCQQVMNLDERPFLEEHPFEAATVQKTLLHSVLNLRIKLAVIFPSPNQAMLRLVFFFLIQKKKKLLRLGTFGFFLCRTAQHNLNSWQANANLTNAA